MRNIVEMGPPPQNNSLSEKRVIQIMWEYLQEMATDRLWIYTAIAGSLRAHLHFI